MSYGYLINSMGKSAFKVNKNLLESELKNEWTEVEVNTPDVGPYLLEWTLPGSPRYFRGGLQSDSQTMAIETDSLKLVAEFATWYRTIVPKECCLFLYQGSTWQNPKELLLTTTIEEIVEAFNVE